MSALLALWAAGVSCEGIKGVQVKGKQTFCITLLGLVLLRTTWPVPVLAVWQCSVHGTAILPWWVFSMCRSKESTCLGLMTLARDPVSPVPLGPQVLCVVTGDEVISSAMYEQDGAG